MAKESGPYPSFIPLIFWAARFRASSQEASRNSPFSLIKGVVSLSGEFIKSQPNRPLTQSYSVNRPIPITIGSNTDYFVVFHIQPRVQPVPHKYRWSTPFVLRRFSFASCYLAAQCSNRANHYALPAEYTGRISQFSIKGSSNLGMVSRSMTLILGPVISSQALRNGRITHLS